MERVISWRSPKIWIVLAISVLSLMGLFLIANKINPSIEFADPNLEQAIREKIGKPLGSLKETDLMSVIKLDASGRDIHNLEGIKALKKLSVLNLADNAVEDLRPLADLEMLKVLNLSNNEIWDLNTVYFDHISHLELRELSLRGNHIQSIEPLL